MMVASASNEGLEKALEFLYKNQIIKIANGLVEEKARVLLTNHRARGSKTKANPITCLCDNVLIIGYPLGGETPGKREI